jgi:hypothetical protein
MKTDLATQLKAAGLPALLTDAPVIRRSEWE